MNKGDNFMFKFDIVVSITVMIISLIIFFATNQFFIFILKLKEGNIDDGFKHLLIASSIYLGLLIIFTLLSFK